MPFVFREKPDSRSTTHDPPTLTLKYTAYGTTDSAYVTSYAIATTAPAAATAAGILWRQDVRVDATASDQYDVTIPYGKRNKETGQMNWSFDTTGGTINVKSSKSTVNSYPAGTAPDNKQLIAVHGDDVDGAEIVIPALKLTVNFTHPMGFLTLAQAKFFARLTGKVNSDTFLTFDPGEVLYLGCSGNAGTDTPATISHQFACSENLQSAVIGAITGVEKDGWDVAWIAYKDAVDTGSPVKEPQYVYVERVYDRTSLSLALGFGG